MGRKKIEIRRLADDRNRQVTFLKRKAGLMKKAWELSVLCSADVAVIVFSQNDKAFEFCSSNIDDILIRYTEHHNPIEHKDPADFAAAAAADSGNPLHDSDDGEDDGDDEPVAGKKGKKAPAPKGGKKATNGVAANKRQSSSSVGPSQAAPSPSSLDQPTAGPSTVRPVLASNFLPSISSQNNHASNYTPPTIVPPQQPPMSQLHPSQSQPHAQVRYGQPTWQQQQQAYPNGLGGYGGMSYGDQNGSGSSGGLWGDGGMSGQNGGRQSSGTPQPTMESLYRSQHQSAPSPFGSSSSHNPGNSLNFLFNNSSSPASTPQGYYSNDQIWNPNSSYASGLLHTQLLQQQQYLQQQVQQQQQQNQQHPLYAHPMLLAAAAAAAAVANGSGSNQGGGVAPSSMSAGQGGGGFSWPITNGGPSTNGTGPSLDDSSGSNLPSVSTTTNEDNNLPPEWQTESPLLADGGDGDFGDGGAVKQEVGESDDDDDDDGDEEDDGDDDYVEGGKRRKSAGAGSVGGDKRTRVG